MAFSRATFHRRYTRISVRLKKFTIAAGLILLAINLSYSLIHRDRLSAPEISAIVENIKILELTAKPIADNWCNLQDSAQTAKYLEEVWINTDLDRWDDRGLSLLLYQDSTLCYWSNYAFTKQAGDTWLHSTGTLVETEDGTAISQVYHKGRHTAVVFYSLYNAIDKSYNTHIFSDQYISLLPRHEGDRAKTIGALAISAAENTFYVVPQPVSGVPLFILLCGWIGLFLVIIGIKNAIQERVSTKTVFAGALALLVSLILIRWVFSLVADSHGELFKPIYGADNHILRSLGDMLVNFFMFFIVASYLYRTRNKLIRRYRGVSRTRSLLTYGFGLNVITAAAVALFHYFLILSIYTPHINLQLYNIFEWNYTSAIFYLLAALYFATRLLLNKVSMLYFPNRDVLLRVVVNGLTVLAFLAPLNKEIHNTSYLLVLFHSGFILLSLARRRLGNLGFFLSMLVVFSAYITFFATLENITAQNSSQRLYARILATSPKDRELIKGEYTNIELESDPRFAQFTYLRVSDKQLEFKRNNINNYSNIAQLLAPNRPDTAFVRDSWVHYVYHFSNSQHQNGSLIVSRKSLTFLNVVSLFAYIFFIILVLSAYFLDWTGYNFNLNMLGSRLTFRIRFVVLGIVFFSMILVLWIVVQNTMESVDQEKQKYVNSNIQRISTGLKKHLRYNSADKESLDHWLEGEKNESDYIINIFGLDGTMITSTTTAYSNFVSNAKMRTQAYREIHILREPLVVIDDKKHQTILAFSEVQFNDRPVCYVGLRYNTPILDRKAARHQLLVDVLNLFLVILFVAVILSELLYRTLTKPFKKMREAMKNISNMQKISDMGESHEISDEVGMLVEQYNRMIDYLDESYRQLARSEREGAWRDMARQVAHEIKNPLTPMRLKIQMLQRAMREQHCDELRPKVESTLDVVLEQIDLLNNIASEFSDFAKLGEGNPRRIDLLPVIGNSAKLYSSYPNIRVLFEVTGEDSEKLSIEGVDSFSASNRTPIWVYADREHLGRVFVNLFQNAVQAIGPDQEGGEIRIGIKVLYQRIWISVTDNGSGIPDDVKSRIFQPNFTTKGSGSGLGLPMCRKIIELLGGEINFESQEGHGTTFTVDLPLAGEVVEVDRSLID